MTFEVLEHNLMIFQDIPGHSFYIPGVSFSHGFQGFPGGGGEMWGGGSVNAAYLSLLFLCVVGVAEARCQWLMWAHVVDSSREFSRRRDDNGILQKQQKQLSSCYNGRFA